MLMKPLFNLISLNLLLTAGLAFSQPIPVTLSDTASGLPGSTVSIPVEVGDLSGRNVLSYQGSITFDPGILTATGVSVEGTISQGLSVFPNIQPGQITLGAFSVTPLGGSGVLVKIIFEVNGASLPGQSTVLAFQNFVFNSGNPPAALQNGLFTVTTTTDLDIIPGSSLPKRFVLYQNYPNPFNAGTMIRFEIAEAEASPGNVRLSIYDVSGRLVRLLLDDRLPPGAYRVLWNGRDGFENPVASGVYFFAFSNGDFMATRKMLVAR